MYFSITRAIFSFLAHWRLICVLHPPWPVPSMPLLRLIGNFDGRFGTWPFRFWSPSRCTCWADCRWTCNRVETEAKVGGSGAEDCCGSFPSSLGSIHLRTELSEGEGGEADGKIERTKERTKERRKERKKERKKGRGILFIHLPCSFLANGKNPPRVELPYLGAGTWLKLFVTGQKCSSRPTWSSE